MSVNAQLRLVEMVKKQLSAMRPKASNCFKCGCQISKMAQENVNQHHSGALLSRGTYDTTSYTTNGYAAAD